ncbi:class I SAM-dependent methyltransferase [Domibacillus epiphyticus]|uniref:SAM-dependent methyltransferase n=1 Tax=Domibacillus epiphyticus TaxID=1714355 RepID=A0A1V2A666_9BACI|nr:class I SAM-dependent methyltransferase [Domibacillus epiphyticus]OMP66491.1 SAM-dependent methyltransferase [Domibacillus epiphyticus]
MNDYEYDQLMSIQTTGDQYGFPSLSHYHRYEPTPYKGLEQLFSRCELAAEDGFVDVGCGKGRVAFYVHCRFQASVVGIEMNPAFYEDSLQNKAGYLRKMKRKRGTVDFQRVLAQDYEVQPHDNVFYFFNPFSVQIFMSVIQRILLSVEQSSRQVTLILYYPSEEYMYFLQNQTVFELVDEIRIEGLYERNENERFLIFQL